ncbi:MAG: LysR family transcriptional regulator [Gammaproteobacteria bacterium]|nr:LysR family transcriptional regulator [Gammaproteobacteria bacterium]
MPRVTLEQWRALVAVVEAGGHAQAAAQLHKSQSSVTAAIHKLQSTLGLRAFELQGRRAVLTPAGQMLYQRARALLEDAGGLERAARRSSAGWEAEITIAIEVLFPTWLMLRCLARFGAESPQTRIEWLETVMEGTQEALRNGVAQLGIAPVVPPSMSGEPLMAVHFVPAAHPDHALHRLGRELTMRDLRRHRHLVVRDTALRRDKSRVNIDVAQRWTVGAMATSIGATSRGLGFAWFPEDKIRQELAAGQLAILPIRDDGGRRAQLHLVLPDPDAAGPGTRRLAQIIREEVARDAHEHDAPPPAARPAPPPRSRA